MFTKEQPDWNWKNEDVRADFIKTLRFWHDHGADGFRVDMAHGLAKDLDRDDLDDYVVWCTNDQPEDGSHPVIDRDEVHDIYHEWRKVFNEYDPPAFAVAEAWVRPSRQHLYASRDDLGQIFNFEFAKKDWSVALAIEEGGKRHPVPPPPMGSNHSGRHSRYALPQVSTAARLAAARRHHIPGGPRARHQARPRRDHDGDGAARLRLRVSRRGTRPVRSGRHSVE